jgi:hypothetical protein
MTWNRRAMITVALSAVAGLALALEIGPNDVRISAMGPDGSATYGAGAPGLAYNAADLLYLVVWHGDDDTGSLANDEHEIFGQLMDGDGRQLWADDFRISTQGTDGDPTVNAWNPHVAWNSIDNEYLVVWSGDRIAGELEIWGQRVEGRTGGLIGGNFRISDMGADGDLDFDAHHPRVAHNPTNNEYLVVWSGDDAVDGQTEIWAQRLDNTAAEIGANDFPISQTGPVQDGTHTAHDPDLVWNSVSNQYLVVWSADELTDEEFEIHGQRLDDQGTEIGDDDFRISDMGPEGDVDYDADQPAVAYNNMGNEYLIVWRGDTDGGGLVEDELEIFGQLITGLGNPLTPNDFRISSMGPDGDPAFDANRPHVVWDGADSVYFVVWDGDSSGSVVDDENEIFAQALTDAGGMAGGRIRLSDMGTDGDAAYDAFAPQATFHVLFNEFFVVFEGDDTVLMLADDEMEIFGQTWADAPPADIDADGVRDRGDLCPGFDDNLDADGDRIPDDCDLCEGDDATGDADGDQVCGDRDPCFGDNDSGDADGDGYCDLATNGVDDMDCDDSDPEIHPGAVERCNSTDDDCDGAIPGKELDADLDGVTDCEGDCLDSEATMYPGAPELCDGLDNDCDGVTPPDEVDMDGDLVPGCADCDDEDNLRFPGLAEMCDSIDNDCDGEVPPNEIDADGDGVRLCGGDCDDNDEGRSPHLTEICTDEIDNDCNGEIDDCGCNCSSSGNRRGRVWLLLSPWALALLRRRGA